MQSSVSAQVAALERELGVRLFDRLGREDLADRGGICDARVLPGVA